MGKAGRQRRRRQKARDARDAGRGPGGDSPDAAGAALKRLVMKSRPGRMTLAGAYAHGLFQMADAPQDGDEEQTWPAMLDPLELVFAGLAIRSKFRNGHEAGSLCAVWLRRLRGTGHWPDIERFIAEVLALSQDHDLAVNDPDLMLLAAGRLEAAGLDERTFPRSLTPDGIPDESRIIRGARDDVPLPDPPADAEERIARFWSSVQVELKPDDTPVDRLRHGVYRFDHADGGVHVRFGRGALQAALFAGVTGAGLEDLETVAMAGSFWGRTLPDDSALVPVIDIIETAWEKKLGVNETLGHLFGLPGFSEATLNDDDREYHGMLGTSFARLAIKLGYPSVNVTGLGNVIGSDPLHDAARRLLRKGPGPGQDDLPEDGELVSVSEDEEREIMVSTMESLSLHPAWIHAYRSTGLLPEFDGTFAKERERERWNDAVSGYFRSHDPGGEVDDASGLERLQLLLTLPVVMTAAGDGEYAAGLVRRLDDAASAYDRDVVRLKLYLARNRDYVLGKVRADSVVVARACELARAWSGPEFADRVRRAAEETAPGEIPDGLLLPLTLAASVTE